MSSAVNGATSSSSPTPSSSNSALNGMNASDFLNLMIKQLQQQDPMNPTDSNQLLTQMSQIGSLQSNTQLQQTLTQMGLQQSIGASGNLIGKQISGVDTNGDRVSGTVVSVKVENQKVNLELDTAKVVPMNNIITVAAATPATGADSLLSNTDQLTNFQNQVAADPTLAQLLSNSSGSGVSGLSSLASLLSTLGAR